MRYLINADNPTIEGGELSGKKADAAKAVEAKLDDLGFYDKQGEGYNLTYITENLDEAIGIANKAQTVLNEWMDGMGDGVGITTQPECPSCGKLGRFSHFECSGCGTELIEKKHIDF